MENRDVRKQRSPLSTQIAGSGSTCDTDRFSSQTSLPTGGQVPPTRNPKSTKNALQFIQIHKPSGKADSAAESQLRSHLMRKYHENRRRHEKRRARDAGPFQRTGCEHTGVFYAAVQYPSAMNNSSDVTINSSLVPTYSSTTHGLSPEKERPFVPTNLEDSQVSDDLQTRGFIPISKRGVICSQCGELLLQYLPSHGDIVLGASFRGLPDYYRDPFNSAAIPITHEMHAMLHHFIFYHSVSSNPPIYNNGGFLSLVTNLMNLPLGLSDAACIHSLVAHSIYQQVDLRSKALSPTDWATKDYIRRTVAEACRHVQEAIRLLNKKFENPEEALSTSSLWCAANLGVAVRAYSNGDANKLIDHQKGLLKMVELRGGIDMIPRGLANLISRSDSNMQRLMKKKPNLPMYKSRFREVGALVSGIDICNNSISDQFLSGQRVGSLRAPSSPFRDAKFETLLWGDLFSIACDLKGLSYILDLNVRQPSRIGPVQREFFEDTFAAAQHSLASFPYPYDDGILTTTAYQRQHCWREAATIYLNTALRKWDTASSFIRNMVSELVISLRASDLVSMWNSHAEVLLWELFIGFCAAWDEVERSWLLVELRYGIRLLKFTNSQGLEEMLKGLLYVESMQRENLHAMWQEINP